VLRVKFNMEAVSGRHSVFMLQCFLCIVRLHPNNVIGVRSFGDQFMCASLVEACNKYIQKFFVDVARSDEFLSMEQKDIVEVLSNDELHVSSEEQVLHPTFYFQTLSYCCFTSLAVVSSYRYDRRPE